MAQRWCVCEQAVILGSRPAVVAGDPERCEGEQRTGERSRGAGRMTMEQAAWLAGGGQISVVWGGPAGQDAAGREQKQARNPSALFLTPAKGGRSSAGPRPACEQSRCGCYEGLVGGRISPRHRFIEQSINRYRDTYWLFANIAPRSPQSSVYGAPQCRRPADFPLAEGRGASSRGHFR